MFVHNKIKGVKTAKFGVCSEFIQGAILNARAKAKAYSFCNYRKRVQCILNSEPRVFCRGVPGQHFQSPAGTRFTRVFHRIQPDYLVK